MTKTILLAIQLLSCACFGIIKEITVTGFLDPEVNPNYFDTTFPSFYTFRTQFDTDAVDLDPDPTHGSYEFTGLRSTLDFAQYHVETNSTSVQVFSGNTSFGSPQWGFIFGSGNPFTAFGIEVGQYDLQGLFLSFDSFQSPTDELKWIELPGNQQLDAWNMSFVKMDGFANGVYTRVREVGTGNGTRGYTIQTVPEPTTGLYLLLSCFLLLNRNSSLRPNARC